jgi:hypothetical protein
MNYENFEKPEDVSKYLHFITNNYYSFAAGAVRKWGNVEKVERSDELPFYQLMPDNLDDGFFNWYCVERPYNQFFKTKEMCIIYFVKYWLEWNRMGKPTT